MYVAAPEVACSGPFPIAWHGCSVSCTPQSDNSVEHLVSHEYVVEAVVRTGKSARILLAFNTNPAERNCSIFKRVSSAQ